MTYDEFFARTGYEPSTNEEWRQILRDYNSSPEHKDIFCRRWIREKAMADFQKKKKIHADERLTEKNSPEQNAAG